MRKPSCSRCGLCSKTPNGADVGDHYMSLIDTCELCGANPFDYAKEPHRFVPDVATASQN